MRFKLLPVAACSIPLLTTVFAQDLAPLEERLPAAVNLDILPYALPTSRERQLQLNAIQGYLTTPADGSTHIGGDSGVDWERILYGRAAGSEPDGTTSQLVPLLQERAAGPLSAFIVPDVGLDSFAAPVAEAEALQQVPGLEEDDPAWTAIFDDLNEAHLLGNVSATAIVGESLLMGRGTAMDQDAGIALLTKAMGAGIPAAFTASGAFLLTQPDAGPDAEVLGLRLLEQGYQLGDGNAALALAGLNMDSGRTDLAREQYIVSAQFGDTETQMQARLGLGGFCTDPDYDCVPQEIAVAVSRDPLIENEVLVDFGDRWPERYAPLFTAARVVFPFRSEDAAPPWRIWFLEETTPTMGNDLDITYTPLIERDDFLATIDAALEANPSERLLLHVHGFNNSIQDALLGIARLKSEGQLPGIPMIYSWAAGKEQTRFHPQSHIPYLGYSHDIQIASSSCDQFRSFLVTLTERIPADRIILFGHSHGAKLIHSALTDCEFLRPPAPSFNGRFGDVIYVAPDIDRDQFLQSYGQLQEVAEQVTFYASDKDNALYVSGNVVRGGLPRLGVGGGDLVVVDGVSAIDASALPGIGDADFGHAYAFLNRIVLEDIRAVLNSHAPRCRIPEPRGTGAWILSADC